MMTTALRSVEFFLTHAGYNWTADETPEEGQLRTALRMAEAEHWAEQAGYRFEWSEDHYGDHSYTEQPEFLGYEVTTCELCVMFDEHGETAAVLGCIDDADRNYRRVVEAELASEIMP